MKLRLLLLPLVLILLAGRADATIAYRQSISQTFSHVGSAQSLAMPSNVLANSVVLASCGEFDNGGGNLMVFYDGLGAHFTLVTSISDSSTFRHGAAVYIATVTGPLTATCFSTSSTFYTIMLGEYIGADNRYPIGVFNQTYSASGSSKSAGPITTVRANQAIITMYYDDHIPGGGNYTATVGSGFTIREQAGTFGTNTQGGFADKIVSSIQTGLDPAWSDSTWATDGVTLIILTLNEAFSAAPPVSLYQSDAATASGTTVSKVFPGATPAGDLLFVSCIGVAASVPTLTITDGTNTYTNIDSVNDGSASRATWAYVKNVAGATYTPACGSSLSSTNLHIAIFDIHNADPTAPLDQHAAIFTAGNAGTGLVLARPAAITTVSSTALIIAHYFVFTTNNSNAEATNYINRAYDPTGAGSSYSSMYYDQYLTATGTFRPNAYAPSQEAFAMISLDFVSGPALPVAARHSQVF